MNIVCVLPVDVRQIWTPSNDASAGSTNPVGCLESRQQRRA